MVNWRGIHLPSVYVHSAICEIYFGVVVFHKSLVDWRGVHLPWVYVHSFICATSRMSWCSTGLLSSGGKAVHLPLVYVHASICETYWV